MFELLVLGFILGWILAILYLNRVVSQTVNKLRDLQNTAVKNDSIPVLYLETHQSVIYAWNQEDTFVSQASSIETLISDLTNRLQMSRVVLHTGDELLFVRDGEIFKRMAPNNFRDIKQHHVIED